MGQMQLKNSDLEAKAQLPVVLRETKHDKISVHLKLSFSGRDQFCAKARKLTQLENVSSKIIINFPFIFRDIAALFNYTCTVRGPK